MIHESWGLHSDELSVTQNPDGCVPPDPSTDYIDTYGDGTNLVYSAAEDGLVVYDPGDVVGMHEPTKRWSGIRISVKKTLAWSQMLRNPHEYGVTVLRVPLNEICWKNFFRKAGTSLRNGP